MPTAREPKYTNNPATEIYQKSEVVFNSERAKELAKDCGKVVIVEGYFDAIAAHSAGVPAVATGGAAFTAEQAAQLRTIVPALAVSMDCDAAGFKATQAVTATLLQSRVVPALSACSFASNSRCTNT